MKTSIQKLRDFVLNPNILILLILIIAGFLRIYRIEDYMTFLGDEGRDVLVVYDILHGNLTLLGPAASVGGFFLGPIYYYFMAPFLWIFNYNPVGPSVMVALFGIATVYLLYRFLSELFSKRVGLIASFLYSISPLVIFYSRSSWNPNLMPFFSLLAIYVLYRAIKTGKLRLFLILGIVIGILMQLHYLAFFVGAIVADYVLAANLVKAFFEKSYVKQSKEALKQYLFIFFGFIIGLSPFLAFEVRHGFPNTESIFNFITKSGETGAGFNFFSNIFDVFFRLFARLVASFPQGQPIPVFWQIFVLIIAITSLSILVYHFYKNFPISKSSYKNNFDGFLRYNLLLTWSGLGIILFGFYKKPIYDYYFGFMFVVPFTLIALSLDFFILRNRFLKSLAILVFLVLIALNLYEIPFKREPNRQVQQAKTISEFVLEKTEGKPFNFALIAAGNSNHAYRYFFKLKNQDPVVIEPPATDPQRRSVTDQLFIICESPCQPLGHSLWEVAGFGRAEIEGEWDIIVVKVYKMIHYKD
jgi:4-amino-4-deoxy-L-arabinose transferase-like glycosyltransferase